MNEDRENMDIQEEMNLKHYGTSPASGRYPLGSGEEGYQRHKNFQTTVKTLRAKGWSDNDIARHLQMNSSQFRAAISQHKNEINAYERALAVRLKEKGMSTTAIAIRMFKDPKKESQVRNLLKENNSRQAKIFEETAKALKEELEKNPYLDVGKGAELYLGVTEDKLKKVLSSLEKEGYKVHPYIQVEQYGTDKGQNTTVKVLTKEGVTDRDIYQHLDEVKPAMVYSEDGGVTFRKIEPPTSISSDRVYIRYAEQGGTSKDGVIEIRPNVEDLSLGKAHYAQVRIGVDGTRYLKGMAMYSDNIPDGYDIVFNTNKTSDIPKMDVLKKMKADPSTEAPSKVFGAAIKGEDQLILARQRHYIDKDGNEKLSAINIVNEEGNWGDWTTTVSAQMLSKQPPALAKKQLDLTYQLKSEQLNDIMSLTNPTVKRKLLEQFADKCDSDAVHLKAYGFPGTAGKVILPVDSLPDDQIYAPTFENGSKVVCIRYPHAGIFEIPSLTVNNNHPDAKKILGNAIDAVGINSKVAQHLSGADFDGDTVYVIPNPRNDIRFREQLKELKGFDPSAAYPEYPGMKVISESQKQKKMGMVTNLITDMTVASAPFEDIAKAVKHSMVIIDSEKHRLDWKRSEKENDIKELIQKYQVKADGKIGGANTLISRAKSEQDLFLPKGYYKIDKETGKKIFVQTGEDGKRYRIKSTQMAQTEDARTLISGHNAQIERVYAQYANNMKALALKARKEMIATPLLRRDPEARKIFAAEVESLTAKLRAAKKNKPLERQAQILANVAVKQAIYDNPNILNSSEELKKLKGRTLQEKRLVTGALKQKVTFTDNEWKAIQSGAVSDSFLKQLLNNADDKHVKQLSMPREKRGLSGAQESRIRQFLANGYTQAQIASMLDISVNSVSEVAKESR